MGSDIRTYANEYVNDKSGKKIGSLSIRQVGRAGDKQGVNFGIGGLDIFDKSTHTSVTLETEQIKLLIADLTNKLSGGIHQDEADADYPVSEEEAYKINYSITDAEVKYDNIVGLIKKDIAEQNEIAIQTPNHSDEVRALHKMVALEKILKEVETK